MARGEALTAAQKRFVVQQLACFSTPSQAAKAFKEEFALELKRSRVAYYDPTTKFGAGLADDLKVLFATTRKAFLENIDAIPIANLAVRLRRLDRMAAIAEEKGNMLLAADFGERAAKDIGGAFTNRRELMGKGGAPLPSGATVTIFQLPDNGRS